MGETISGDGRTEVDVSAVAKAYSRPYYDGTSGAELGKQRALEARPDELQEFKRQDVYTKVLAAEASEKTGRRPISRRWVGVNKGDDCVAEYRSRLVAREVERSKVNDVLSAMPPLGAKEGLFPGREWPS